MGAQNILCVVDLANPALAGPALQRASALAALDDARLTVLTVAPDIGLPFWSDLFAGAPMQAALDQANAMLEAFVNKTLPGVKAARYQVAQGDPAEKIPELAAETGADLIVLGPSHAEVAAGLVREGGCSVYLARG